MPSSAGTEIAQDAAALAMLNALGDCNPADPIEAMLLGQIISANATALELRQRAWRDRLPERQAALLKLADKSARTLATSWMLWRGIGLVDEEPLLRSRGASGAYAYGSRPADLNPRSPKYDTGVQTIARGIV